MKILWILAMWIAGCEICLPLTCHAQSQCEGDACSLVSCGDQAGQQGQQSCQPKQEMPNQELTQLMQMLMQLLTSLINQNAQNSGSSSSSTDTSALEEEIAELQEQLEAAAEAAEEDEETLDLLEKKAEALAQANVILLNCSDSLTDAQKTKLQAAIAKIANAESVEVNSDGSITVDDIVIHEDGTVS